MPGSEIADKEILSQALFVEFNYLSEGRWDAAEPQVSCLYLTLLDPQYLLKIREFLGESVPAKPYLRARFGMRTFFEKEDDRTIIVDDDFVDSCGHFIIWNFTGILPL